MLDGASGRSRWVRPMRPDTKAKDRLTHLLEAPDLDGDGTRDLVAVSRFDGRQPPVRSQPKPIESKRIYVDALSGKDGRALWWWHVDIAEERLTQISAPLWWGRGPDGWPLLAVAVGGLKDVVTGLSADRPDCTHVLEASSGREVHTIVGLTYPGVADLDGDGLMDLWGHGDSVLQAFRGQAPEIWRALGKYAPAGRAPGPLTQGLAEPAVDFDRDGFADALIGIFHAPSPQSSEPTGSRTIVARSGRTGRAIWKTRLDSRPFWDDTESDEAYVNEASPLPVGDFDGDGIPDVVVWRSTSRVQDPNQAASLPLDLISGRNGRQLWSAGALPLGIKGSIHSSVQVVEPCVIDPGGAPDLIIVHSSSLANRAPGALLIVTPDVRLARISGRDGRVIWDTQLMPQYAPLSGGERPPISLGDVDGDGSLDAVVAIRTPGAADPTFELRAIALRDGKTIWSKPIERELNCFAVPQLVAADLDGDARAEVVVSEKRTVGSEVALVLSARDGRDGRVLWTWESEEAPHSVIGTFRFADFEGDRRRRVCLDFSRDGWRRLVILDEGGRELARKDLQAAGGYPLVAADLNGDGRDELVLNDDKKLQVLRSDLSGFWLWPDQQARGRLVVPGSAGTAGAVIVDRTLGLDGADGQMRWRAQQGLEWHGQAAPALLDAGDATRLPLLLVSGDSTVCRSALATTVKGACAPPSGARVRPGQARNDPRWMRPLPWTTVFAERVGLKTSTVVVVLALVNVVLPLATLRLAARRRPWTIRLLMALPLAAAVPLCAVLTLEPLLPARALVLPINVKGQLVLGTLAGLPVVVYLTLIGWGMLRRRWLALAALAAFTAVTSLAIGAIWVMFDMRRMPAIEHYAWSSWPTVFILGAYGVGAVATLAWAGRGLLRIVWRPGRLADLRPM